MISYCMYMRELRLSDLIGTGGASSDEQGRRYYAVIYLETRFGNTISGV